MTYQLRMACSVLLLLAGHAQADGSSSQTMNIHDMQTGQVVGTSSSLYISDKTFKAMQQSAQGSAAGSAASAPATSANPSQMIVGKDKRRHW